MFSRHRNAANLTFLFNDYVWRFRSCRIEHAFFPTTEIKIVNIRVIWPGATAQDVDKNTVATIQPEVRFIDGVKEFRSTRATGSPPLRLSFTPKSIFSVRSAMSKPQSMPLLRCPKTRKKPIISQRLSSSRWCRCCPARLKKSHCAPMPSKFVTACQLPVLIKS